MISKRKISIALVAAMMLTLLFSILSMSIGAEPATVSDAGNTYADALVESSVNTNYNVVRGTTYQLDEGFTESPKTMEALVNVGTIENWKGGKGPIIGGFNGKEHFNLEITKDNKPRLWWRNGEFDCVFDYQVPMNEWVHLVIVRDDVTNPSNPQLVCYVNGQKVGAVDGIGTDLQVSASNPSIAHYIGRDVRLYNFFAGSINYVGVSSKAMTEQEVASAYQSCQRLVKEGQSNTLLAETCVPRTYYLAEDVISEVPNTITATVCIDKKDTVALNNSYVETPIVDAADTSTVAYILSTQANTGWGSLSYNTIELSVNKNGNLQLIWDPLNKGATGGEALITFDTAAAGYTGSLDIRTGNKIHITVVRNKTAGTFDLYLNGQLASTSAANDAVKTDMIPSFQIAVGHNRVSNGKHLAFPGQIYDVALYANAMTSNQVAAENAVSSKASLNTSLAGYTKMITNWVLDSKQQDLRYDKTAAYALKDYSGNGLDATLCTLVDYFAPETDDWFEAGEDEYTMIYVPDTQCTVHSYSYLVDLTFDWMVANKDAMNLQLVMGLGDITDGNTQDNADQLAQNPHWESFEEQYDSMAANYEKLTEAGIFWSSIVGNHDYDINNIRELTERKAGVYNEHFGYNTLTAAEKNTVVARFHTDAVSSSDDDMLNVIYEYTMKTKGGQEVKYLLVALEFGPSKAVLDWANEIVSQPKYANHRILFNTHSLIFADGHFGDITANCNPSEYWYNLNGFVDGVTSTNGDFMWDYFISQHPNMFLTASGHIETPTNFFRQDKGVYGNTVMSMLCDGQGLSYFCSSGDDETSWGDPLILVVKVNERTKTLTYRYYNPVNNCFLGVENQVEFSFEDWGAAEIEASSDIAINNTDVQVNSTVEFTINKQDGFAYAKPVVKTVDGEVVVVVKTSKGYAFAMPDTSISITVEKFDLSKITLPEALTLSVGEVLDLSDYLPEDISVDISIDNSKATLNGNELTAEEDGEVVIAVTSDKYGKLASCTVTLEESAPDSSDNPSGQPSQQNTSIIKIVIISLAVVIMGVLIFKRR